MTQAGLYRRRVDVQAQVAVPDSTGSTTPKWVTKFADVPCSVAPYRSYETFAAQQTQNDITWRVMMRRLPGLDATMRLVEYLNRQRTSVMIYNIEGVLPDPTNRRDTELTCRSYSQEGFRKDGG